LSRIFFFNIFNFITKEKGYRFAEKGCTGIITVYAIVDGMLVAMDITLLVTGHLLRLI
jgi:hypothetical protein